MPATMIETLSDIRTVEGWLQPCATRNIAAYRWKAWYGRMVGSVRPAATSFDRACRSGHGQAARPAGAVSSMLKRRLPVPVHPDKAHASAFGKTSPACLAEGHVAVAAVGQRHVLGTFGGNPWGEPPHHRRRVSPYQSAACRSLFPRDGLWLVPACRGWSGCSHDRSGRQVIKTIWSPMPPALQLMQVEPSGKSRTSDINR